MPRIQAETVIAHRLQRESAILAAAQVLLLEHGPRAVTPSAVASAVGLTRTAIYKYFASSEDILRRIVDDSFATWQSAVATAVDGHLETAGKIDAYIATTLSLGADGAHRIAVLAGGRANDDDARTRLAERHQNLSTPLADVLRHEGIANAALIADLIDGVLGRAIAQIDAGAPDGLVIDTARAVIKRALDLPNPTIA